MERIEKKRTGIFLVFAFGLSWAIALVIFLTGGIASGPRLLPGIPLSLLLLSLYMWMPAIANLLARGLTGEGRRNLQLAPRFGKAWPYWLLAWGGAILLSLLGAVAYFFLLPENFDGSLIALREQMAAAEAQSGEALPVSAEAAVAIQMVLAASLAPVFNSLFAFGEEFGWRGYLQPKLLVLGRRRALLLTGFIWGVWHWPVIAMGHNYGSGYTGYPWAGMLAMVWFTVMVGVFLGWLSLRGDSVWPAVIGHATLNATAGMGILFTAGGATPLLGPSPLGIIASVGWVIAAAWILARRETAFLPAQTPCRDRGGIVS